MERDNALLGKVLGSLGGLLKSFWGSVELGEAFQSWETALRDVPELSCGALGHLLGIFRAILAVFGRLWGLPWVFFGMLLGVWGRKMLRILGEDGAKDGLEVEILS